MKINTIPVEAYRQVANQSRAKSPTESRERFDLKQALTVKDITLPGNTDVDAGSVRVKSSPSLLSAILSSDEKEMLVKHFARFGDSPESPQIYDTKAGAKQTNLTGIRLDVKG